MSEFFFDYKCISMSEERKGLLGADDKALDFFLYQDYNLSKNNMCVQVYIPHDMQRKYCGAKLFFVPNGTEFPDIYDPDTPCEVFKCSARVRSDISKTDISDENSIFIRGDGKELSGCGIIAFIDGSEINAPPKPENAYKFVINYAKKEVISYAVEEHKGKIAVRILYPLIRNDIELNIIVKPNAKPVLIEDRKGENKYLSDDGEKITIRLKPTGRITTSAKYVFRAPDSDKNDYRLVFAEQDNNKYYLLVDESDYTIEDKKERIKSIRAKNRVTETVKRCPYCGGKLNTVKGVTGVYTCGGNYIGYKNPDVNLDGKYTVVCGADLSKRSEKQVPVKTPVLPYGIDKLPSINVVVAGYPKAGKTIFLASVMNMSKNADKVESRPFILDRIVNVFDSPKRTAKELEFLNIDDNGKLCNDWERKRFSTQPSDGKIKLRYVLSVGKSVEKNTPRDDAKRLSWNPIGYRMGDLGFMYFYDLPGELFTDATPEKNRSVDMADCFLAVIDGSRAAKDALLETRTALERINAMANKELDLKNIPIAILFTKHDRKLTEYVPPARDAERGTCFDENCHVVREDMLGIMPRNGVYGGSSLERHVDCSSYELEHYLKAQNAEEFAKIMKNYNNIKFFTCSALGNDLCLKEGAGDTKDVLFRPRRLRVELPLIWLMYKTGMIK